MNIIAILETTTITMIMTANRCEIAKLEIIINYITMIVIIIINNII